MSYQSPLHIQLKAKTPPQWIQKVLANFDPFLIDHAACERKASGTAISFTVAYPDRQKLIDEMIGLAREELQHYHQVNRLMNKRGIQFTADEKDPYVSGLMKFQRHGGESRLLDRLLIFGLIEARGCERFQLVADHIEDADLKDFYKKLAFAESRHHQLFVHLALEYFPKKTVVNRLEELAELESKVMLEVPIRSAVH